MQEKPSHASLFLSIRGFLFLLNQADDGYTIPLRVRSVVIGLPCCADSLGLYARSIGLVSVYQLFAYIFRTLLCQLVVVVFRYGSGIGVTLDADKVLRMFTQIACHFVDLRFLPLVCH